MDINGVKRPTRSKSSSSQSLHENRINHRHDLTPTIHPVKNQHNIPPNMALGLIQEVQDDDEQRAKTILSSATQNPTTIPDALQEILTTIIKPLFSSSKHPQLTETGRKRLVPTPSIPGTFTSNHESIFDTSRPWKNNWTTNLLQEMLSKYYYLITLDSVRGKTIESHFHLLVPPILILIDDIDMNYKVKGCDCLTSLCRLLISVKSNIMTRTGLAEVFIDTLKNNFIHLPPLTPELESLRLLQSLYPAFFAVVEASYPNPVKRGDSIPLISTLSITSNRDTDTTTDTKEVNSNPRSSENRYKNLTLLLRHSLLYALNTTLSTSSSSPEAQSIPIYLLSQLPPLLTSLNPNTSRRHLQSIIPLLRRTLSDPMLPTTAPDLLLAASSTLEGTVSVYNGGDSDRDEDGQKRNEKENGIGRWWTECLHAAVECWMNLEDEMHELRVQMGSEKEAETRMMEDVRINLRKTVVLLRNEGNKDEFGRGREEIIREEGALKELFEVVV